jgi:hypothetical protein
MSNDIVIFSDVNTGKKKDATGAFIPEARLYSRAHEIPKHKQYPVTCTKVWKGIRRERTIRAIMRASQEEKIDSIAFFGHGWSSGIQFGFNRGHIKKLVQIFTEVCNPNLKIILYACLTGKGKGPGGDGGFADCLRDEMALQGLNEGWVDSHSTSGHTTFNPFVRRFLADYPKEGGAWIVEPGSVLWRKWREQLKTDLRFRFPFMSELEIKAELSGVPWTNLNRL